VACIKFQYADLPIATIDFDQGARWELSGAGSLVLQTGTRPWCGLLAPRGAAWMAVRRDVLAEVVPRVANWAIRHSSFRRGGAPAPAPPQQSETNARHPFRRQRALAAHEADGIRLKPKHLGCVLHIDDDFLVQS
jgi:hypothetical protein